MKAQAIIPCAGVGTRLKTNKSKPFVNLNGRPIFIHTLASFAASTHIDSIVLAVHPDEKENVSNIIKEHSLTKEIIIVEGGATRCASVFNALKVADEDTDIIVVHDAARPLIETQLIDKAIEACIEDKAIIIAVPVKPTIKRVKDGKVIETLNRSELWEVQTPQVFSKDLLIQAHAQERNVTPTDDAMLVEQLGVEVHVIEGSYTNIKITTIEDLRIAETFLEE